MLTHKPSYVFRRNPTVSHSSKRSGRTETALPLFGANKPGSTDCPCELLSILFAGLIPITALIILPIISVCLSDLPFFPHLYWIPGIVVSGIVAITLLFGYQSRILYFLPAALALIPFYILGFLKLLEGKPWEWYQVCIPIYVSAGCLLLGLIKICCCNKSNETSEEHSF